MAATSRPDMVDVALLRSGRVDKSVYCGFPTTEERTEIIKVYLKKFNFKSLDPTNLDNFIQSLVQRSEHFTSADIKGLIQNAQLAKMSRLLKEQVSDDSNLEADFSISETDIMDSLKSFVKGISDQERNRFLGIYAKY